MTPVHLAVFLLVLPMIFVGGMALGYSQGFALAIRRQSSRNYGVRAEGDDHLRAEEKGAALLRSWLSPEQAELLGFPQAFLRCRVRHRQALPHQVR